MKFDKAILIVGFIADWAVKMEAMYHDKLLRNIAIALRMAVRALMIQQEIEDKDTLSRKELRRTAERCRGVYVASIDGKALFRGRRYCAAVLDIKPVFGSSEEHIQAIYGDRLTLWEDDYGKTWVAYRYPPKEANSNG